tara:strand:+ start:69 stop:317 length:249 start_codon:yes stop_codon:yes gene_type:complete
VLQRKPQDIRAWGFSIFLNKGDIMGRNTKPISKLSKKTKGRRTVGVSDETYSKLRKLSKDNFRTLNNQVALLVDRAFKDKKK